MSNIKFDIKDAVSKQNFINLRLAGFSLDDISDALGVSYPTVKRIYDELKPEINSQIAKTKCFDNSALTKKIESFLNALEKHFYIMEEGMIETHNNMNYEQYIASILKFTNAFEKLVKLRILLNSSQIQQDVSQSNITNTNDPCDPEIGSTENNENDENVPQTLSRDLGTSLLAGNDIIASTTTNEPCDPENGSQNYESESEQVVIDNEIDRDNISFYKYRKLKMKNVNSNLQNENNSP